MRTDANLSDTGLIRVEGSAHRAISLGETPLQLHLNWSRGQLGQITTLLRGRDAGWRGSVQLNVNLTGTPRDLHVVADSTLEDFRRYDIFATDSLTLFTHCTAKYSNVDHTLSDALCLSPVGQDKSQYEALRCRPVDRTNRSTRHCGTDSATFL